METGVVVSQQSGIISCNFDEVKNRLMERLDEYKGAVFTEDSKQSAKLHLADLRKEKKEFSDRISEVKEEFMKPYVEFEGKAKELLELYDEPINLIDGQVKDFEDMRKEKKRALISDLYEKNIGEAAEYATLDGIYNPRWENATYKENDIVQDIKKWSKAILSDVTLIKSTNCDIMESVIETYKANLSLSDAMAKIHTYESNKRIALERENAIRKRQEEDRIRREERERIAAELKAERDKQEAVSQAKKEVIESLIPEQDGMETVYQYRINLTADAKEKLEMYMDSVGIEWELS